MAQEFHDYIIKNPGSIYARDYAISSSDIDNIRAKVVVCEKQHHTDEVRPKHGVSILLQAACLNKEYGLCIKRCHCTSARLEILLWFFLSAQGESVRILCRLEVAKGAASEVLAFQDAGDGQPMMICFATEWMLRRAYNLAHGKAILLDATFGTNSLKVCCPWAGVTVNLL